MCTKQRTITLCKETHFILHSAINTFYFKVQQAPICFLANKIIFMAFRKLKHRCIKMLFF